MASDASRYPATQFLVLAKQCDGTGEFFVDRLGNEHASNCDSPKQKVTDPPKPILVTQLTEQDVVRANADLYASIREERGTYDYVQVIERGPTYTDVSLTTPTKGDFWQRSWYRIENGAVHPQRICSYGPLWSFFILPITLTGGGLALLCYVGIERYVRRRRAIMK